MLELFAFYKSIFSENTFVITQRTGKKHVLEPINMQAECLDVNHNHPKLTFGLCRGWGAGGKRHLWSEADGKFYLRRSLHGNYCAVDQFSIQTQGRRALFTRPFNRRLDWTDQGSHPEDAVSLSLQHPLQPPHPPVQRIYCPLSPGDPCWTRFKW